MVALLEASSQLHQVVLQLQQHLEEPRLVVDQAVLEL
jgi:hypothetical protein